MGCCEPSVRYLSTLKNRLDPEFVPVPKNPKSYGLIPMI